MPIPNPFGTQTPSGGWQYVVSQTGWTMPSPVSQTLNSAATLLVKHAKANPALAARHKLPTDFESAQDAIVVFNAKRLNVAVGAATVPFPHPARSPLFGNVPGVAAVIKAAENVRKVASGAAVLFEWEQSQRPPVAHELAEARAAICVQCPKNKAGASLTEYFTVPAAQLIKQRFERLHAMKLNTAVDAQLSTCLVCLCPLAEKVHAPLDLILKHIKPEWKSELPAQCWMITEK